MAPPTAKCDNLMTYVSEYGTKSAEPLFHSSPSRPEQAKEITPRKGDNGESFNRTTVSVHVAMNYSQHKGNKPIGVPPHFHSQVVHRQQQPLRNQPVAPQSRAEAEHTQVTVPHRSTIFHQQSRHPSPGPIPSPGIPSGASPSPSSSPGVASTSQGLATGTAHDMSKQGSAPSHPGLAPSPHQQGNVVQQPPQQPQQPQPSRGVILQQQYILPQQQAPQLRPVYVSRINNQPSPRGGVQIQSAPTPSPQQITAGSQMNAQFMSQAPFMVMPVVSQYPREQAVYQQGQYQSQSQPQQQFQQRTMFPQQYPQQATPAQMYPQPGTPPYYTNSPPVSLQGATFFTGANQTGMVVAQPPHVRAAYSVLPRQPQYNSNPPPRERKFITIVDPDSNEDITDTIIRDAGKTGTASPHSGQSRVSDTPPTNLQADKDTAAIQAKFAADVARLAHDETPETQLATDQVTPHQSLPPTGVAPKPGMPSPAPHLPDPQPQIASTPLPVVEAVPVAPIQMAAVEPSSINQAVHPSLPQETKVQGSIQAVPSAAPVETSSKAAHLAATSVTCTPPVQPQSVSPPSTDSKDAKTVALLEKVEPNLEQSDSRTDLPNVEEKIISNSEVSSRESDKSDQEKLIESSKPSKTETKLEESFISKESKAEDCITAKQAAKEESAVLPTQESAAKEPSKKKNQKNRFREIDKKPPKDEDEYEAFRSNEKRSENMLEKETDEGGLVPEKQETAAPELAIEDDAVKPETDGALDEVKEPEQKEVVVINREDGLEQDIVETENAKNKEDVEDTEPKESLKDNKMQLKYSYRDDQWSPMNPGGKKQYGREFLLQFQPDCKEKPEGLPHIPDIVLEKADIRPPSLDPPGRINRGADFTPSYLRSPRPSQTQPSFGQGMGSGAGGRRSSKEPKKVIQRVSQTIKLNTAGENAWKPDKDMPSDDEEAKTKDLFKKMKALLNKLTPNNFDKLKTQAMNYPIDTEERLTGIIDLVFEKAVNESAFSKTYAKLCRDLSQLKVPAESGNGNVHFRTLLINRCQKEFEKEKTDEQEEKVERDKIAQLPETQRTSALEDLEIKLIKNKKRMLGNIRFIGELFMLQMLIEQIMHDCIYKLLCSKDDESLECMVHLLMTIGKSLDHEKAKNRIDQYFKQIRTISNQKAVSARIRFMLQDLLELRVKNWVPRRADDKPKTIEQIRKDHKREEEQKLFEGMQAQAQLAAPPPRMSRNKRDQPPRVGPPQNEGWNTVSSKAARVSVDPNKFKVAKSQNIDEDIQLGPGRTTFGGWCRGSSGGSSKAQSSQDANRFMMLSEERKGRGAAAPEIRGRGPPGFGGKRSSSSRERDQANRERQSAIAEAQKIGGKRSHSKEKDREPDIRRGRPEPIQPQVPVKEPPKPAPALPELSPEQFEKKSLAIIEEYVNIRDVQEAITCVSEMNCPTLMGVFVESAINYSLEKTAQARDLVGLLFHSLLKAGHLTNEKFVEGVNEVLAQAEDMALDIPLIWKYLGEIIGSVFRDNSLSLTVLGDMMESAREARKAADLMAEILLTAVKINGANVVAEMWKSAGFTWQMFLPDDKDVQEFVNNKKLEFTLIASSGGLSSGGDANGNNVVTDEEWVSLIKRELGGILRRNDNVNNEVFDWVQKNLNFSSSEERRQLFIRALVTVVVQSTIQGEAEKCKLNRDLLVQRTAILKRYIDNNNRLELEALYAVQALNQHLENPPQLLGHFFDVLYDEDVIPEETFYAWKDSTDPNETLGKGVALKSVTSFFDWLREAEEEPASKKGPP